MALNRFRPGMGVFICEDCSRKTRGAHNTNMRVCKECLEREEHVNSHVDCQFPDDKCGMGDKCLIKHYTPEQRWWLK
jgi:hypothetical protein